MKQALLLLTLAATAGSTLAQTPMVAYRKELVWHFYDSQNKLILKNELIAPSMVGGFIDGYSRVRSVVGTDKKNVKIGHVLLDTKGKIHNLPLPGIDSVNWRIDDILLIGNNERVVQVTNNSNGTTSFVNGKNKLVPASPLFHTHYMGEGLVAGFGKMPLVIGDNDNIDFNHDDGKLRDFEIWSITNATKVATVKAQELGLARKGLIPAKKDDKWGIIDFQGKWVCQPTFADMGHASLIEDEIAVYEPSRSIEGGGIPALAPEGKWGLVNTKGKWLAQPQYTYLYRPNDVLWLAGNSDDTQVLLNNNGQQVLPNADKTLNALISLGSDSPAFIIMFSGSDSFFVYNGSNNKITFGCNECTLTPFDDKTILVQQNDKQSFINTNGQTIAQLAPTTERHYLAPFSHNISAFIDTKTQKHGYVNHKGEVVFPAILNAPAELIGPDFLYLFDGSAHIFYDHKGKIIRKDEVKDDADWDMMTPLYGLDWPILE